MKPLTLAASAALALAATTACGANPATPAGAASIEIDGARFEISDAAVYSDCLTLAFAVRAFELPPGSDPQVYFPPAKTTAVEVATAAGTIDAQPLGGGGGGGGDEEDGRIWMEQRTLFSLAQPVPEGEEVTLRIGLTLDEDFGRSRPLSYEIHLTSGPGGGSCR